jgi:hypothetical protein
MAKVARDGREGLLDRCGLAFKNLEETSIVK